MKIPENATKADIAGWICDLNMTEWPAALEKPEPFDPERSYWAAMSELMRIVPYEQWIIVWQGRLGEAGRPS